MVETFIEATDNDNDAENKKLKRPKYSNLSKKVKKTLEKLKVRDGILITIGDKGGAVVYYM